MTDRPRAFVPGHVTGFFTADPDPDPTKAGSRGGGIALSAGVTVRIDPGPDRGVVLNGEPVEMAAVDHVLEALSVSGVVRGETDLPLGSGFGVSGAMALGAALVANAAFDRRLSERELVTVAHGAEVRAGTGLGDVVAQARGGIPIRLEPGGPAENELDGIPQRGRIEYHTVDELATADVLDGETGRLTDAGERALSTVVADPTLDTLMRASRRFSRESGLLTDRVRTVIEDVSDAGGTAAMAMLGETVFALGTGLSDAGYESRRCRVHAAGGTLR